LLFGAYTPSAPLTANLLNQNNVLTLPEMVTTVTGWINLCTDERQLATCQDFIDDYIDRRFKNHVAPAELALTLNKLRQAMEKRKTKIYGFGEIESVGFCPGCKTCPAAEPHTCPYKEDVESNKELCTCCPACQKQCQNDI
jgi:hypothetical protein